MARTGPAGPRAALLAAAAALLLAALPARALLAARHFSPTYDEVAHLPAGASYLATGDFRLNPEHPPLAKALCALPLVLGGEAPDVAAAPLEAPWRIGDQWVFGISYLYGRGRDAQALLMRGRIVAALLAMLLGLVVFLWSRRLWGDAGGVLSLALYTLCPTVLAHAPLVHTDMPLALAATAAVWTLWRFGHRPSGFAAAWLIAGAAMAVKFSGAVVPLLLATLTVVSALRGGRLPVAGLVPRLAGGLSLSLLALAGAYGFAGAARYLDGIAVLRAHAEAGHAAYFMGEVSMRPWLAYFPVAFLVKTPLATIALVAAGVLVPMRWAGEDRAGAARGLLLWLGLPAAVLLALPVAGGLNLGVRYLLPAFPFLFVIAGRLAAWTGPAPRLARGAVVLLLVWLAAAGAAAHPDYLAYFNEAGGGSAGGARWLSDSNLDWGQDLPRLAAWMREESLPGIYLAWFGSAPPGAYGIRYRWLPGKGASSPLPGEIDVPPDRERLVVSVHCLLGAAWEKADPYSWLRDRPPLRSIGASLRVFDITGDAEAHRHLARIYRDFGREEDAAREAEIAAGIERAGLPGPPAAAPAASAGEAAPAGEAAR